MAAQKMASVAVLLFTCLHLAKTNFYSPNDFDERTVSVGALCEDDADCGTSILHCSNIGVCLCDKNKANYIVQFRHHFDIREHLCEKKRCTNGNSKELTEKQCDLENGVCKNHVCGCLDNQVGSRKKSVVSDYGTQCRDVEISSVGESCSSRSPICDLSKKLRCIKYTCACFDDHVFDFDKDYCVTKEEYTNSHGYYSLGEYKTYCNTYSDCNSGMSCNDHRCDCPSFCSSELVKTEDSCYCPTDYVFILTAVLPAILILGITIAITVFTIKRRNAALAQLNQQGAVIVIQPGAFGGRSRILTPQEAAELNLSAQQNIPQQFNALQQQPFNPQQQTFNPQQQTFNPQQQTFNPQQQTFNPQQQTFNPQQQTFNPQQQTFNPQQQTFNPQQQTFNPQQQTFNPQQQTFNPQQQTFNPQQQQQSSIPQNQQQFNPPSYPPSYSESMTVSQQPNSNQQHDKI